ncbi:MAG: AAA family ATPase [Bacteroidales bacterium]
MGARETDKTTLLKNQFPNNDDVLWLNGRKQDVQIIFSNISATRLMALFGNKKYIVIDEAQRIDDLRLRLKLTTD